MKKTAALLIVILVFMCSFCLNVFGEEAVGTTVPTSTAAPEGIVLDSSIVFGILIIAAGIGVAGGYWFARRR